MARSRARGPAAAVPAGTVLVGISAGGDSLRLIADDFTIEPGGACLVVSLPTATKP